MLGETTQGNSKAVPASAERLPVQSSEKEKHEVDTLIPEGSDKHRVFSATLNSFVRNVKNSGRSLRQRVAVCADWCFSVLAITCAYELKLIDADLWQFIPVYVVVPLLTVFIFSGVGVYSMMVRFSSLEEMAPIVKGVIVSAFLVLVVQFLIDPKPDPRSAFVIYGLLLLLFCGASRHLWKTTGISQSVNEGVPVAIYGAGSLGRRVMDICRAGTDYRPVVWLDDNENYHGRMFAQAEILDPKSPATPARLKQLGVETILMAIASVDQRRMKAMLESLQRFDCSVRTLPSIDDIMANRVTSRDTMKLPLEELIGRKSVAPDMALMVKNISGKVVMVTGAGGSVGSELCRQILPLMPTKLVLFDVSEAAMYVIEQKLVQLLAASEFDGVAPEVCCVIGNVCEAGAVENSIRKYGVQTLFHAAAYKHVPMVERNPQPAIKTNIFGTLATLEAALQCGVENFTLISTDKAVRPTNVMGATKRVAELIVQAKAHDAAKDRSVNTVMSMVRFGNVIGSSGSVVPRFSDQIEKGGPVTVTHEDIERYFMSIPEAAQLVIQASALAKGGDVFLLDMGQPIKIADLAKSLIYLHGKTLRDDNNPKGEIEIRYVGLREGEKLFEELLIDETAEATKHSKIMRGQETFLEWQQLARLLEEMKEVMVANPDAGMVDELQQMVSEYEPDRSGLPRAVCEAATNKRVVRLAR
jgi:FlaA1/EpsC-like NDP-sugar epimerase